MSIDDFEAVKMAREEEIATYVDNQLDDIYKLCEAFSEMTDTDLQIIGRNIRDAKWATDDEDRLLLDSVVGMFVRQGIIKYLENDAEYTL